MITLKMDPALKAEFQQVAQELGTTISAVLTNAAKKFVSEKKLVIESYIPNEETIRAFKEADEDRKAGRTNPVFDNVDDFINHLNSGK
jgi:addiction module RelB/DinJ family antitoxin